MKKSISILLCLSMLFSTFVFQIPGVGAIEKSVHILHGDKQISEIAIKQNEKEELTVKTKGINADSYQWQLLMDHQNSVWVNVYDKTEENCEVSYAMLKNLLDDASSTYIRCAVTSKDEVIYSDAVCVTVAPLYEPQSQVISYANEAQWQSMVSTSFSAVATAESEYVTITIKYLDMSSLDGGEESAIYSPYTATILKNEPFKQNIVSPTFLGFAPYYNKDEDGKIDDDASTVDLDIASVTHDMEIKVYYKPSKVNFAIRYFFQNINDNLYTEDVKRYFSSKEETGKIIEDSFLTDNAGDTTGFEKMYHVPQSVAADGSTVFECYYDRNYYLLQFDLDGGYGVDPIYARYGTPFVVNDPVKHGYSFAGWDRLYDTDNDGIPDKGDEIVDKLDSTIKTENIMYKALWTSVNTTYTKAYWVIGDNGNQYLGSERINATSGSKVSGKDDLATDYNKIFRFDEHIHSEAEGCYNCSDSHIHTDACITCTKFAHKHTADCNPNPRYYVFDHAEKNVIVEGDGSTIVNIYYKPKEYTLRFYYARSSENDGKTEYQVVGGSTYGFGGRNTENASDFSVEKLLENVPDSYWGKVANLPTWYKNTELSGSTSDISHYKNGNIKSNGYTYYYFEFIASYGENISSKWPIGILAPVAIAETHDKHKNQEYQYAYFSAWNGEHKVKYTQDNLNGNQTIKGRYMVLDENLLYDGKFDDNDTVSYLGFWDNGANVEWSIPKLFRYHLMIEVPKGAKYEYEHKGKYYESYQVFRTFDDSDVYHQTPTTIDGFTLTDQTSEQVKGGYTSVMGETFTDAYDMYFWYDRNNYTLTYFNYENVIQTVSVPFDTLLTDEVYNMKDPRYPPSLEPNAYEFVGWYNSPIRIYPIEFDKAHMPAQDTVWYAKWVPVKHNVNFFETYEDMLAYEEGNTSVKPYKEITDIEHRSVVGSNIENPVRTGDGNENLIFSGWFYIENGEKKAFSPHNMPISRDMNVFADWSSSSPQPYNIQYVLMDNHNTKVADDTFGYAYAGSTRTFIAKAGNPYNQLYDDYNDGYFPTVASHSITMKYEDDKDNLKSNFSTFYYVKADDIEYTVRYVNKETNIVMGEDKRTTSNAVVTERFKAFENMVPDAFYKRLVLSVEFDKETGKYVSSKDNVITFYYTPNESSAYYAVHFMLQKINGDKNNFAIDGSGGYEESTAHMEGIGTIGSTVSITPQEFSGFKLLPDNAVFVTNSEKDGKSLPYKDSQYTIQVTKEGTELYIFYERLNYDYTVHYYIYNTEEKLRDDYKGPKQPYGSLVTEEAPTIKDYTCVSAKTQTISIRDNSDNIKENIIIFYYAPTQYVAEYVAVPSDGGRLSRTLEVVAGNNDLQGSVPTANPYYRFDGWYIDKDCTISAKDYGTIGDDNRFTPDKYKLSETEHNIFYAKFTSQAGDLTIKRENAEADQVFVYEVKNNTDGSVITVTVTGNNSVTIHDLPFREYTVTQQNDWSWRYTDDAQTANHHGAETTVQFAESMKSNKWLNGNSELVKNQRRKSE